MSCPHCDNNELLRLKTENINLKARAGSWQSLSEQQAKEIDELLARLKIEGDK